MPIGLVEMGKALAVQQQKPDWRISKMGYRFDRNSDEWQIDGSTKLNIGRMRELDITTSEGLRLALCRYAEELSGSIVDSVFTYFNMYCDYTGEKNLNVNGLTRWRNSLTDETEYRLGSLKGFLTAWNEWRFPGCDSVVVDYLEELRLKGNQKGKAVSKLCPYSGPFTQLELGALLDWTSNAFTNNVIDLNQYAYFVALIFTGRRPVQIRALRAGDLVCKVDDKSSEYFLMCPRAKQRGFGFRETFRALNINEDLYLLLDNQAEASQSQIEQVLGKKLPNEVRKQVPIFLQLARIEEIRDIEHLVRCLSDTPDYLHMTEQHAGQILRDISVMNHARSERTGEFINFTARRFRYTKGTNLARKGITGVALAYAFDHSDTQQINVYTQNTEEMAEHIDEIMAPVLAPLAQAFTGTLLESERDALRANDPHSRVKNDRSHAIGNCGTHAFCASGYRACYLCSNFQAWRDAPHEEVREEILNERARQKELGVSVNIIQATDRLLLAVERVIQLCNGAMPKQCVGETHG